MRARKGEPLLVGRDPCLVLDYYLDIVDCVSFLDVHCKRLACVRRDEDWKSSPAQQNVERVLLLDVVV